MKLLQTVLTDYAFSLGQAGKIAEAVAPLYAAKRFGGSDRAEEIAVVVAWSLAEQAIQAIEERRMSDALALASLGLAATENPKCVYALCAAFERTNLPALASLARRLDDLAVAMDAPIRLRALKFLASAIFGAERKGTMVDMRDLEQRLVKLSNDHPGGEETSALIEMVRREMAGLLEPTAAMRLIGLAEVVNQSLAEIHRRGVDETIFSENGDLAAAYCAGLLSLMPPQAYDADRRRGALRQMRAAFDADRGATDDASLARLAIIVAMDSEVDALGVLLLRLWERGDIENLKRAADFANGIEPMASSHWIHLEYHLQIAALCADNADPDREAVEAAALDALLAKTDRIVSERPEMAGIRAARTFLLLEKHKFNALWEDCVILLEEMKTNKDLEFNYSFAVSRHCMYLRKANNIHQVKQVVEYVFGDERTLSSEKEYMFYYCSNLGYMELAYEVAARLVEFSPSWGALAYLRDFLQVATQKPAAVFGRPRSGKRVIYGNLVCWGSVFIEKMAWSSLTSLMSPKNIPALVKDNDVVIDLITHESNVEELLNLPELNLLSELCEIRIYCFPFFKEFFEWSRAMPYIVFGHAQHFSVLRAQHDNVDVLVLSADVVYADGCFDFVARNVSDEPRALFYDGLNCSLTPLRERLAPYRVNSVLTIDAKTLAAFAVQTMKPILEHSFFHKSGESVKTSSPALIVRKPFGFRVYGGMQGVVYVSAAGLKGLTGFDHLTLEGVCSEVLLRKLTPEQVIVRTSTDDILWVELDDDDRTALIPLGAAMVRHIDAIRNFFVGYTRSSQRFTLFDMAVDCHVEGLLYGEEIDDETERRFLEEVKHMRLTDPIFTELCQP